MECPNEGCGGGNFCAAHYDRVYCGRCYRTTTIENPKPKPVKAVVAEGGETSGAPAGKKAGKKK